MPIIPLPPHSSDPSPFRWAHDRNLAPGAYWASGQAPKEERKSALPFLAGAAGIAAAGFIKTKHGRVWDSYLRAIYHVEEFSPMSWFRTFRWTEQLSPLGSMHRGIMGPEFFMHELPGATAGAPSQFIPNKQIREFYSRMTGRSVAELESLGAFTRGLEFERTASVFGRLRIAGGEVLSEAAMPVRIGYQPGSRLVDYFARRMGMELEGGKAIMGAGIKGHLFVTTPEASQVGATILGRASVITQYQRSYWHSQIARLNRLLEEAVALPGLRRVNKYLSWVPVKTGQGAAEMLARYAGKGMAIMGGIAAIGYLSHLRSEGEGDLFTAAGWGAAGAAMGAAAAVLTKTSWKRAVGIGAVAGGLIGGLDIFNRGIASGVATAGVRAHMATAALIARPEAIKEQEALMPGITQVKTGIGFALGGGLAGIVTAGISRYALTAKAAKELRGMAVVPGVQDVHTVTYERLQQYREAVTAERAAAKGIGARIRASLWPRALKGAPAERAAITGGRLGLAIGAAAFAGLAFLGAWMTGSAVPGIIGAEKTPEELRRIYSGEEEVPVRKGRWWEAGRTPWEGGRIQYYRQHWYPLMMSGAKDIGLYGSAAAKWEQSPWAHPLQALFSDEFKYRWEREHYYSRPYPMTGTYGEEVPFIAPLVTPIGRMIKPTRLMHSEEWLRGADNPEAAGAAVKHVPTAADSEPAYELGGLPAGTPVSKFNTKQSVGDFIYRVNELRGLTGFMHSAIKEAITGSQDYFDQDTQLATSSLATGSTRAYWDLNLGGAAMLSEPLRRFLPHARNQIQQYNPLENLMPSWMPGEDYYIDFRHGDPFTKVPEGEVRLPGPGYAALHPELAGVPAEQYPAFHRFKILADVAMYSQQFKAAKEEVRREVAAGLLDDTQMETVRRVNDQVTAKKRRKEFSEERFAPGQLEVHHVKVKEVIGPGMFLAESGGVYKLSGVDIAKGEISAANRAILGMPSKRPKRELIRDYLRDYIAPGAELDAYVHKDMQHRFKTAASGAYMPAKLEAGGVDIGEKLVGAGLATYSEEADAVNTATRFGLAQRGLGALWEGITHWESPLNYLQPFAPTAKFIHQRTAVEDYARTRVFGSEAAFWQKPFEHFLRPTAQMIRYGVKGTGAAKPEHIQLRENIEEYFDKLRYIKMLALEKASRGAGLQAEADIFYEKRRRTLFGVDPYGSMANVFSALPALERDYFEEFANAATEEERAKIRHLIPQSELHIYEAQWNRMLSNNIKAAQTMGLSNPEASAELSKLYTQRVSEGRPISRVLWNQYQSKASRGQSYADWSRETELEDYFSQRPLPSADWVGWHPHVDLEDIKLKVVQSLGQDMHDYNLWDSRSRMLPRKPYIDEAAVRATQSGGSDSHDTIKQLETRLRGILSASNFQITASPSGTEEDTVNATILDRRADAAYAYKKDPNSFREF